jgi:hypothetical protein
MWTTRERKFHHIFVLELDFLLCHPLFWNQTMSGQDEESLRSHLCKSCLLLGWLMQLDEVCLGRICQVTRTFYVLQNAMCSSNLSYSNGFKKQRAGNKWRKNIWTHFICLREKTFCFTYATFCWFPCLLQLTRLCPYLCKLQWLSYVPLAFTS